MVNSNFLEILDKYETEFTELLTRISAEIDDKFEPDINHQLKKHIRKNFKKILNSL